MVYYLMKLLLSAVTIVAVSEVAKRLPFWGGLLASLPLVSILAMVWLYLDTRDDAKVVALSWNIFWLVLPSLTLFLALPLLIRQQLGFPLALMLAIAVMLLCYGVMVLLLKHLGFWTT